MNTFIFAGYIYISLLAQITANYLMLYSVDSDRAFFVSWGQFIYGTGIIMSWHLSGFNKKENLP